MKSIKRIVSLVALSSAMFGFTSCACTGSSCSAGSCSGGACPVKSAEKCPPGCTKPCCAKKS